MDITLPHEVGAEHYRRLAWFEEHAGEIVPWSMLSGMDMRLVNRAKGIYKPKGWKHVLSVRTYLNDKYPDGDVEQLPSGRWSLHYHQEGRNPSDRDDAWTNLALIACKDDHIPIGVLRQVVPKGKNGPKFQILGLAEVLGWANGYFDLVGPASCSSPLILNAIVRSELDTSNAANVPGTDYDARLRTQRGIVVRQGQSEFRNALIAAYRGRCAVTGCDAIMVLEAAHLRPYRGSDSNVVPNGLLLRGDLHTLLDYGLLAIEPRSRTVALSKKLAGTHYGAISGTPVAEPAEDWQRPDKTVLDVMWNEFREAEKESEATPLIRHTLTGPPIAAPRVLPDPRIASAELPIRRANLA
jgi:putative restriction endonuclease